MTFDAAGIICLIGFVLLAVGLFMIPSKSDKTVNRGLSLLLIGPIIIVIGLIACVCIAG